jgi:hypothetical protein
LKFRPAGIATKVISRPFMNGRTPSGRAWLHGHAAYRIYGRPVVDFEGFGFHKTTTSIEDGLHIILGAGKAVNRNVVAHYLKNRQPAFA